jgi:hypothetical protein
MLAAAGRTVQYANKEFRCWKNHKLIEPGKTNESAFARAKQNQTDAYTQVYQIQAQLQELREVDLQLMAEEQAKEQNTSVANELKAILKRECDSGIFPLLWHWINGAQTRLINELWTPDNPMILEITTWTAIVERQAIFEALIKNGEEHFSQASHTPFASGPVAHILGSFEFNKVSQKILRGEFDIDSITDDIQLCSIIKAMSHSNPTNPIKADSKLTIIN